MSALWRTARLTSAGLVRLLRSQGQAVNPFFSAPRFTAELICIDVLHACDLGVTQEVLGSIFFEALGVFARGSNRAAQVVYLFRHMQAYYKRISTTNRLSSLTVEMIKQQNKPPKFRAKGAETRHLVPFALEIAQAMQAADDNLHTMIVLQCISALMDY